MNTTTNSIPGFSLLTLDCERLRILSGIKYGLEVFWVLKGDKVVGKFLSEASARTFILSRSSGK